MRSNFVLFSLILASVIFYCVGLSSANEESGMHRKAFNTNFVKINAKFDFLSERVDKLEENASVGNDEIMKEIQELNKKTEKIPKIEQLLLQLIETVNEQKMNKRDVTRDVTNEMTSQCNSLCHAKVNGWANETSSRFKNDLNQLEFCVDNLTTKPAANACEPNPCANGGHCQLTSYRCTKCAYPWTGNHCEILNCSKANRCFQYKNKLYVVFDEHMLWEQALSKCLSEGMTLAMPKDQETTENVAALLKTMTVLTKLEHFYLGLKNNGSEWRWVDGSPLGAYTGNYPNFKSFNQNQWTLLWLQSDMYWYPRKTSEIRNHPYVPLCEKTINVSA